MIFHIPQFLSSKRCQRKMNMYGINRLSTVEMLESEQGMLSIGTGERHRGFQPRHFNHRNALLRWSPIFVCSSDDAHPVPTSSEVTCKMEHNRANTTPSRGVFTGHHGDVHNATKVCFGFNVTVLKTPKNQILVPMLSRGL